jgi:fucose 4-O-acetylase-like acetyltransferase
MNVETNNMRYPNVDFASGIMILWMILFHAIAHVWSIYPCVKFPFLHFFMPWFFYKSGHFFFKSSVKDLWRKDFMKLLKTFAIWSLVGYVFFLFFGYLNNYLTLRGCTYSVLRQFFLRGNVPINSPCWFLLTLFGVRFVANKLLPDKNDKYAWLRIVGVVTLCYVISYLA